MKTSHTLAVISCGILFGMVVGCSSKPTPTPVPINEDEGGTKDSTFVLTPSFEHLAEPLSGSHEIPWAAALTLAEMSKLAYDDAEQQVERITALGATTVRPIVVGLSHGVVASDDKTVVVAFRGTAEPVDWLTDARIVGHRIADGRIHKGFFQVVDAIYKDAYAEAVKQGAETKSVWITGHSLGGAMALVFGYRALTENELAPGGIITFGQPLAFSPTLAQFLLDKFNTKYVRFVNSFDPVPRLLPNYRHAGSRIYMKANEYTYRKPVMAFSAPAGGERKATEESDPTFTFAEDQPELEPMSEEEFEAFQRQLQSDQEPFDDADVGKPVVGAIPNPWYEAHSMSLYIERIKEFGGNKEGTR